MAYSGNSWDRVGYISFSVMAPENGLAAYISFTLISNLFANRRQNQIGYWTPFVTKLTNRI